jgi:hypothetical protein
LPQGAPQKQNGESDVWRAFRGGKPISGISLDFKVVERPNGQKAR